MTAWLVESYWPAAVGSTDAAAARLRGAGRPGVHLIGIVHVPADEMALWRFEASEADMVRAALEAAGVTFERIVEVVDLPAATAVPELVASKSTVRREE